MTVYDVVGGVARYSVGIVFLVSALSKLGDFPSFVRGLARYEILAPRSLRLAGAVVVGCELLGAASLVTGIARAAGSALGLGLSVIFFLAVAVNLHRGRVFPCHCFGANTADVIGPATLVRTGLMAVGAAVALVTLPAASTEHLTSKHIVALFALALATIAVTRWLLSAADLRVLYRRSAPVADLDELRTSPTQGQGSYS